MSDVFIHVGLHKTASTFFQTEVFPHFENTICLTQGKRILIFPEICYDWGLL